MSAATACLLVLAVPASLAGVAPNGTMTTETARTAMERGLEYLLTSQNPNGSWGGPQQGITTFTGDVWSNPETHRSWRSATTALCCLALMKLENNEKTQAALLRGIDYLLDNVVVKRPSEWDVDNNWSYVYGLQALAVAHGDERLADRKQRIAEVVGQVLEKLKRYQSLSGGWGYYDFDYPRVNRPRWATSFMTAAAVIALQEARRQGFDVDQDMVARAVRGIKRCRLPSGAYTYSILAIPDPRSPEWIDQIKGSLSRIQVCHEALLQSGEEITLEQLQTGIGHFFREHRFLDVARNRPIPHEAYYYNSGYFYLFGHYYAAMIIERLPAEDRAKYWPKLQHEVIKTQQKDGSMWDFEMHAYAKPYGVSFGLLALAYSVADSTTNGDTPDATSPDATSPDATSPDVGP